MAHLVKWLLVGCLACGLACMVGTFILIKDCVRLAGDAHAAIQSVKGPLAELTKNINAATVEVKATSANIHALTEDTYYDQVAAVKATNAAIVNANNLLWDIRAGLFGGKVTEGSTIVGLFPQITGLVEDFRGTNRALAASLESLTSDSGESITQATAALKSVQVLINTATKELIAGDAHVLKTVDALEKAINDSDKLISDPNLGKTIGHIEHTTETMAIVTDPWRKKANQILAALKFAVSLLHINIP
jgi:hypothetical protein